MTSANPVAHRFTKLLERLQPTSTEVERYERHRKTVAQRLLTAYPASKIEVIGSHRRATAIRHQSDLDLMVQLPRDEIRWGRKLVSSRTLLNNVRRELCERFPETNVRVDGPAVSVQFGGGEFSVDVVPAVFLEFSNVAKNPIFAIPDGFGNLMRASPIAHSRWLEGEDRRSGRRLKYVVQMLKFWRTCRVRSIPMETFFIEMTLASRGVIRPGEKYSIMLLRAFDALVEALEDPPVDPLGISNEIFATTTPTKFEQLESSLAHAFAHASAALDAEENNRSTEAIRQWDIVFNHCFIRN